MNLKDHYQLWTLLGSILQPRLERIMVTNLRVQDLLLPICPRSLVVLTLLLLPIKSLGSKKRSLEISMLHITHLICFLKHGSFSIFLLVLSWLIHSSVILWFLCLSLSSFGLNLCTSSSPTKRVLFERLKFLQVKASIRIVFLQIENDYRCVQMSFFWSLCVMDCGEDSELLHLACLVLASRFQNLAFFGLCEMA